LEGKNFQQNFEKSVDIQEKVVYNDCRIQRKVEKKEEID